jgi:hypothetical protein
VLHDARNVDPATSSAPVRAMEIGFLMVFRL